MAAATSRFSEMVWPRFSMESSNLSACQTCVRCYRVLRNPAHYRVSCPNHVGQGRKDSPRNVWVPADLWAQLCHLWALPRATSECRIVNHWDAGVAAFGQWLGMPTSVLWPEGRRMVEVFMWTSHGSISMCNNAKVERRVVMVHIDQRYSSCLDIEFVGLVTSEANPGRKGGEIRNRFSVWLRPLYRMLCSVQFLPRRGLCDFALHLPSWTLTRGQNWNMEYCFPSSLS